MKSKPRDRVERERIAGIFNDLATQLGGDEPNESMIGERAAQLGNALWFGHPITLDPPSWREGNNRKKGGVTDV